MILWPWLILVILYGACVGSFLNVVAYRLPHGQSLVRPGSQCPKCGHKLAWHDNLPVLGWFLLRGRCRYCKAPISGQYPLVEAVTAILFGGLFYIYYFTNLRPGLNAGGLIATWPMLVAVLTLVAALVVATVVDFQLYIIPLPIPWLATLVAVILLPVATGLGWLTRFDGVVHLAGWSGLDAAVGGIVGLAVGLLLLRTGLLPRSFDEVEDTIEAATPSDEFLDHPHPRREVLKELLFVAFPLLGTLLGLYFSPNVGGTPPGSYLGTLPGPPLWAQVFGGVVLGYLVGAGLIWGTRILGTLAFGKEAMGLGDVHLLAAIGAVVGPIDVIFVFFIAPFFGLAAALLMLGITPLVKGKVRIIPYGPYLAGAALVMLLFREPFLYFFGIL